MVSTTSFVILALAISMVSCQQRVEIFMSARDLPDMDPLAGSRSPDALLYVLYRTAETGYEEIGRTADISDNNNPDWPERYSLSYTGGYTQKLKFDVYDADYPDSDDYMGYVEFALGDVYNAFGRTLQLDIISGNPGGGSIIITAVPA